MATLLHKMMFTFLVVALPFATTATTVRTISEGDSIVLSCGKFHGAGLVWSKDSTVLPITSSNHTITDAKVGDSGLYKCRNASRTIASFTLKVLKGLEDSDSYGYSHADVVGVCLGVGLTVFFTVTIVVLVVKRDREIKRDRILGRMRKSIINHDGGYSPAPTPATEKRMSSIHEDSEIEVDLSAHVPKIIGRRIRYSSINEGADDDDIAVPVTPTPTPTSVSSFGVSSRPQLSALSEILLSEK